VQKKEKVFPKKYEKSIKNEKYSKKINQMWNTISILNIFYVEYFQNETCMRTINGSKKTLFN